jgi:hypothetical protein
MRTIHGPRAVTGPAVGAVGADGERSCGGPRE